MSAVRQVRLWLGWLLIAAVALLALSCSACTVRFIGAMALDHRAATLDEQLTRMAATSPIFSSVIALVVGAIPAAFGITMIVGGWSIVRFASDTPANKLRVEE